MANPSPSQSDPNSLSTTHSSTLHPTDLDVSDIQPTNQFSPAPLMTPPLVPPPSPAHPHTRFAIPLPSPEDIPTLSPGDLETGERRFCTTPNVNGNGHLSSQYHSRAASTVTLSLAIPKLKILAKKVHKEEATFKMRLRHFTFAVFSTNMATGSLTTLTRSIPYSFGAQYHLGLSIFIINAALFFINVFFISLRFYFYPKDFLRAVTHPKEGMFVPACVIAFCLLLEDLLLYLTDPPTSLAITLFIIYLTAAIVSGVLIPFIMFLYPTHSLATMLPAWMLSIYPFLMVGNFAGVVLEVQEASNSTGGQIWTILIGLGSEGAAFLIALLYLSSWILRLVQYGLPKPTETPSMFVAAGVPSLTAGSLMRLFVNGRSVFVNQNFLGFGDIAGMIGLAVGTWMGAVLTCMGFWFASIALISLVRAIKKGMRFSLVWWSCVFPMVNWCACIFLLGEILQSTFLKDFGLVTAIILYIAWLFILLAQIWAIWTERIMHPEEGDENFPIYHFSEVKSGLKPRADLDDDQPTNAIDNGALPPEDLAERIKERSRRWRKELAHDHRV